MIKAWVVFHSLLTWCQTNTVGKTNSSPTYLYVETSITISDQSKLYFCQHHIISNFQCNKCKYIPVFFTHLGCSTGLNATVSNSFQKSHGSRYFSITVLELLQYLHIDFDRKYLFQYKRQWRIGCLSVSLLCKLVYFWKKNWRVIA